MQSPERLKLLLMLTATDIRAVGPNVWNGWKGQLLRELYQRGGGGDGDRRPAGPARRPDRAGQGASWPRRWQALPGPWTAEAVEAYLARHDPRYWLGFADRGASAPRP